MKKLILILMISFSLITPVQSSYALDAKSKAFLVMCTYGTVGGALLGFASLAFGTNSRAIAQGASLGLYAGIAFGSYVVVSHKRAGEQGLETGAEPGYEDPYYDDGYGAPQDDGSYGAPGGQAPADSGGGFFGSPQRSLEIQSNLHMNYRLKNEKGRKVSLPLYINFFNTTF